MKPPHSTPGGAARTSAWLLAASTALLLTAACRDLVTDEVVDAESALCDRLAACGLTGCGELAGLFADENTGDVDAFLRRFATLECDQGCGVAPLCLDTAGVCLPAQAGCTEDYLCCGASGGEARCQALPESAGMGNACCKGAGVACTDDFECCFFESQSSGRLACTVAEGTPGDVRIKTCGGLPLCASLNDTCTEDADCCSRSCDDGVCVPIRCIGSGGACEEGVDSCCAAGDSCREGTCAPADACSDPTVPGCCREPLANCADAPDACCEGTSCLITVLGAGFCSSPACLPEGADCSTDAQCKCGDLVPKGACLQVDSSVGGAQRICGQRPCSGIDEACDDAQPCCVGACSCEGPDCLGVCEQVCEPTECAGRNPHEFGAPIPRTEDADIDDLSCVAAAACADLVCAEDPYCCCFIWDEFCVAIAEACAT